MRVNSSLLHSPLPFKITFYVNQGKEKPIKPNMIIKIIIIQVFK